MSGTHYARTSEAWHAALLDDLEAAPAALTGRHCPPPRRAVQVRRWRMFFLACAELFGFDGRREWQVSHYRLCKAGGAPVKIAVVGSGDLGPRLGAPPRRRATTWSSSRPTPASAATPTPWTSRSGGRTVPVDTGFIVFNERTYPNFLALLRQLGVSWKESDMSFSVRSDRRDFEYAGDALAALFAQRRNLLSPRFHRMVLDILRFYREATGLLDEGSEVPLLGWLRARGYSRGFVEDHLLPHGRRGLVVDPRGRAGVPGPIPGPLLREPRLPRR